MLFSSNDLFCFVFVFVTIVWLSFYFLTFPLFVCFLFLVLFCFDFSQFFVFVYPGRRQRILDNHWPKHGREVHLHQTGWTHYSDLDLFLDLFSFAFGQPCNMV